MGPHPLGERETGGLEHRGPDDAMVARDVLADDVELRGPARLEAGGRIAGGGEVVREGVEPDPGGLLLAIAGGPREGDAPREACAADGNVLQTPFQQPEDLVAARLGLEETRLLPEQPLEKRGITGEADEPVPLLGPAQRAGRVQDALAVHDLVVALEGLAPDAVPPLIGLLVDVVGAAREDLLDQRADAGLVRRIGRADELVVGDAEAAPHAAEGVGELVHELLWGDPPLLGGLRDLLAVLVHPDEEVDGVAAQAAVPRDGVRADLLEGVPEMRVAVRVVYRGGEVEAAHRA